MSAPTDLRVEHLEHPLGITDREPRLSWRLPVGSTEQVAYQLEAGDWDSGRVEGGTQLLVPYGGGALASGQRVSWRVKVWTDLGESDWSEASWFETGLLEADDWTAQWVEPAEQGGPDELARPAQLVAGDLELPGPVSSARLFATAHGVYEAFIDGQRVGDQELAPGSTYYFKREQVQTYDVTDLLDEGPHRLALLVSDGWYRGQVGGFRNENRYGNRLAVLAQLHVTLRDGSSIVLGTGEGWHSRRSAVVGADLIEGQTTRLDLHDPAWLLPQGLDKEWQPVTAKALGLDRLCTSPAPPVRRVEEIRPVSVERHEDGSYLVDLGQNINGWLRMSNLGPARTEITLRHGEALDADGRLTVEHLILEIDAEAIKAAGVKVDFEAVNARRPFQVDTVTSAGHEGEVFEPRHTEHGFRYVQIEGHPGPLTEDDVTGIFVHSDLRRTGWFECSNGDLNQLHDIAVRSLRGNMADVPTDCPQRERSGWTGDWQLFAPTAAFLYDVAGFSTKWLRDLAAGQRPSGLIEHHAPTATPPVSPDDVDDVDMLFGPGCAGWGDAAVIVPWETYRSYGDERLLAEQWPSMKAWVDHVTGRAASRRHFTRENTRPEAAPHERYIWDSGFQWGEWLEPGEIDEMQIVLGDKGDVGTAYFYYSTSLLAKTARVLGRDDARHYEDLAEKVLDAWRTEFIGEDGSLSPDTQANHVRALAFGLVPDRLVKQTTQRLVELIREADTHLGTGFLATPYLLPELARNGHLDLAYELLLQRSQPSWLAMIDRGATTVWEFWEGVKDNGEVEGSLNHYSKGAVISFLHRNVAGIRMPETGDAVAYRRFVVQPEPGGGLTWARGTLDSPYGRIESAWQVEGSELQLDVTVPSGTVATVVLPSGDQREAGSGRHRFSCELP